MKSLKVIIAAICVLAASESGAATFDFDATYDGTGASLTVGSDPVDGTVINVGDTFNLTLSAEGSGFWTVGAGYTNQLFDFSFVVNGGTRTGNAITNFFLDGSLVASISELGVVQSFVHLGAQSWTLSEGLRFDTVSMDYELLSSNVSTVLSQTSSLLRSGAFYQSSLMQYTVAAVPVPASLPIALTGIGLLGLVGIRRRDAATSRKNMTSCLRS